MKMLGKTIECGPGGRACVCCYPAPKNRKADKRTAKRRERNNWKKEVA